MIILADTNQVLRARLADAVATSEPTFAFAWGDDSASRTLGNTRGALNGTTNVDLVAAPAAATNRVVRSGFVYNGDTAAATVIIEQYDGTDARPIARITLAAGYTLAFSDSGFRVTDSSGAEIDPSAPATDANRIVANFAYGDASPSVVFTAPDDCTSVLARLVIDTPFDGASPSLKLGTTTDAEALLAASDNDPATAVTYDNGVSIPLSSGDTVLLTITPGSGATQGAGRIIFDAIAT